jgi:hypothetical protein
MQQSQNNNADSYAALRMALLAGATIWLVLLVIGFVAPGGWTWGMPGPVGHIENYMISLWAVTLVVAPMLARRDPAQRPGLIQVYLLGILAIVVSGVRGERPQLLSDGLPILVALASAGGVILAHPERSRLWQI